MSDGITKLTIEELNREVKVTRPNPTMHAMLYDERYAYITDNKKYVGILMRDKVDNDFSFVVLKIHEDKRTEAFDLQVSIATEEKADKLLRGKLSNLSVACP